MKYGRMAIVMLLLASAPTMATTWRAFGDDMAGGTVEVWFSAVPPGGGNGLGPYVGVIVGTPATKTGAVTIVPGIAGNSVTFTVTGNTWSAPWIIANNVVAVPVIDITRVRINLALSAPPSMFDSTAPTPGTAVSRKGRDYTFVAGGGFAADPQTAAPPLYNTLSPVPGKPANVGDLFDVLDMSFGAAGNLFVDGRILSFQADTDIPKVKGFPPPQCLDTDEDFDECVIAEPNGACCSSSHGSCFDADDQAECDGTASGTYLGDGTSCATDACSDPIPTVSEWGLGVMLLLVLTAGTVVLGRRRYTAA